MARDARLSPPVDRFESKSVVQGRFVLRAAFALSLVALFSFPLGAATERGADSAVELQAAALPPTFLAEGDCPTGNIVWIDLLVLYSDSTGDPELLRPRVDWAISGANLSLERSRVRVSSTTDCPRFRLVGFVCAPFPQASSVEPFRCEAFKEHPMPSRLRADTSRLKDQGACLRDLHRADVVAMIVERDPVFHGYGNCGETIGGTSADAFITVFRDCLPSADGIAVAPYDGKALGHELGHIFGGSHQACAVPDGTNVDPPYAKGWVESSGIKGDLMSVRIGEVGELGVADPTIPLEGGPDCQLPVGKTIRYRAVSLGTEKAQNKLILEARCDGGIAAALFKTNAWPRQNSQGGPCSDADVTSGCCLGFSDMCQGLLGTTSTLSTGQTGEISFEVMAGEVVTAVVFSENPETLCIDASPAKKPQDGFALALVAQDSNPCAVTRQERQLCWSHGEAAGDCEALGDGETADMKRLIEEKAVEVSEFSLYPGPSLNAQGTSGPTTSANSASSPLSTPSPIEVVSNGSFEARLAPSPWKEESSHGGLLIHRATGTEKARSGAFLARLGGSNSEIDELSQELLLPEGAASPRLRFWYRVRRTGNGKGTPDRLTVEIDPLDGSPRLPLWSVTEELSAEEWTSSPLLPLEGQSGRLFALVFRVETGAMQPASFFLDDVSVQYVPSPSGDRATVVFLNPRTGCHGLGRPEEGGGVISSGTLSMTVLSAGGASGARTTLRVGGREVASTVGRRLEHSLRPEDMAANEPIDVEAELASPDGTSARCPIRVFPRQMLTDTGFENGFQGDFWKFSGSFGATRSAVLSGTNPPPSGGDYLLRLGGSGLEATAVDRVEQTIKLPADAGGATLSIYVRVFTTKTIDQDKDFFRVKLEPADGSPVEVLDLLTLTNRSGTNADSSGQGMWHLLAAEVPPSVFGKMAQLVFEATSSGSGSTWFFVDDVGLTLVSNSLRNPPSASLSLGESSSACSPRLVRASTSAPVASLRLLRHPEGTVAASCESCNSVEVAFPIGAGGCRRFRAVAELPDRLVQSEVLSIVTGSSACGNDSTHPSATLAGLPSGTAVRGTIRLQARGVDSACVAKTEILIDGEIRKGVEGELADLLLDSTTLPDGLHSAAPRAVDAAGNQSGGGWVDFFQVQNVDPCHGYGSLPFACQPTDGWSDPQVDVLCPMPKMIDVTCTRKLGDGVHHFDLEFLSFLQNCARKAIVRITAPQLGSTPGPPTILRCTGVLLSKREVLTSSDCIARADLSTTTVSLQMDPAGLSRKDVSCVVCGGPERNCLTPPSTRDGWTILKLETEVPLWTRTLELSSGPPFEGFPAPAVLLYLLDSDESNVPAVQMSWAQGDGSAESPLRPTSYSVAANGSVTTDADDASATTNTDEASKNSCLPGAVLIGYDRKVVGVVGDRIQDSACSGTSQPCRPVAVPDGYSLEFGGIPCVSCGDSQPCPVGFVEIGGDPYWARPSDSRIVHGWIAASEEAWETPIRNNAIELEMRTNQGPWQLATSIIQEDSCYHGTEPCADEPTTLEYIWTPQFPLGASEADFEWRVRGVTDDCDVVAGKDLVSGFVARSVHLRVCPPPPEASAEAWEVYREVACYEP